MGKPKHQAQARKHRGFDWSAMPLPVISMPTAASYEATMLTREAIVNIVGEQAYRTMLRPNDEIIKVVGIRDDGMAVTSIRDSHQQVHDIAFPQDEE